MIAINRTRADSVMKVLPEYMFRYKLKPAPPACLIDYNCEDSYNTIKHVIMLQHTKDDHCSLLLDASYFVGDGGGGDCCCSRWLNYLEFTANVRGVSAYRFAGKTEIQQVPEEKQQEVFQRLQATQPEFEYQRLRLSLMVRTPVRSICSQAPAAIIRTDHRINAMHFRQCIWHLLKKKVKFGTVPDLFLFVRTYHESVIETPYPARGLSNRKFGEIIRNRLQECYDSITPKLDMAAKPLEDPAEIQRWHAQLDQIEAMYKQPSVLLL